MVIKVQDLKFDKHYLSETSEQVKGIVSPLLDCGIKIFNHFRIYNDNAGVDLTTTPDFCEFYARNHLYREACVGDWDQYQDGYYFWDTLTSAPNAYKAIEEQCKSSHGIVIIRRYENCSDQFHIGGFIDNPGIKNFFINSRDYMEKFIEYYYQEAQDLIINAYQHRYCFPGDKRECSEILKSENIKKTTNFLKIENKLTKREFECVKLCSQGYTSKVIARCLHISPKTVDRHLENAQKKIGVHNRLALVDRVFGI